MKQCVLYFLVLFLFSYCQPARQGENQNEANNTSDIEQHNKLTEEQQVDGWILLFNGENMEGWRTFKNKENDSWEVVDGTLHCKPSDAAQKRADIITVEQFDNFELVFDWKVSPKGNSGVMFRVTEEFDQPYFSGPEYQILDDENYPGKVTDVQLTASNYDMHPAPSDKGLKPAGEWNTAKIVVNGNHVEHWLNGVKVVEYELGSDDWKTRKANSKWKDVAGYGIAPKGHIDLQDHGDEVWYRNIKVKRL